jgi:hypothetical protein
MQSFQPGLLQGKADTMEMLPKASVSKSRASREEWPIFPPTTSGHLVTFSTHYMASQHPHLHANYQQHATRHSKAPSFQGEVSRNHQEECALNSCSKRDQGYDFFFSFPDKVSLCYPSWPETCHTPAPASQVLGLQVCTITPDLVTISLAVGTWDISTVYL